MEKEIFDTTKIIKTLYSSETSSIFITTTKKVIKIFNDDYLNLINLLNESIEDKVLYKDQIESKNTVKPNKIITNNNKKFIGYELDYIKGYNLKDYFLNKKLTLKQYNTFFKKLRDIIEALNNENIVLPDLATNGNILINNKINIIDYDGLQINKYPSFDISTLLNYTNYNNSKYKINNYYTKELDKKSLIYMYFLYVFNVDMRIIDINNNKIDTINNILNIIGINNIDTFDFLYKLYDMKEINEYIDDRIFMFESDYELDNITDNYDIKKLIKK